MGISIPNDISFRDKETEAEELVTCQRILNIFC